jgi:hypothetical protein
MVLVVVGLAIALVGVVVAVVVCLTRLAKLRRHFSAVVVVDAEVARLRASAQQEDGTARPS